MLYILLGRGASGDNHERRKGEAERFEMRRLSPVSAGVSGTRDHTQFKADHQIPKAKNLIEDIKEPINLSYIYTHRPINR